MSLCVTGYQTSIIQELAKLIGDEKIYSIGRRKNDDIFIDLAKEFDVNLIPVDVERYVFAAGLLFPKTILQQSFQETAESLAINLTSIMRICDYVIENNSKARILILSSESSRGSFDNVYFASKVAINAYVEKRKIKFPEQQILAISPTIIWDSGMTQRRHDLDNVINRASQHPKKRFLMAKEVAELIYHFLWQEKGYVTNTVISINGGMFS